jgi:hypothetical protein
VEVDQGLKSLVTTEELLQFGIGTNRPCVAHEEFRHVLNLNAWIRVSELQEKYMQQVCLKYIICRDIYKTVFYRSFFFNQIYF